MPLAFEPVAYRQVAQAAAAQPELPEAAAPAAASAESLASQGLAKMLVLGFLGGLILNLMPCVLPVIGLKVMSFVEQAGQSRREALALNLWYSAGLVSVFLVLATLAVAAGMTWGQHFGNDAFAIVLAAIVFAMALSLVGVWEIPIPGFVGGATAHELSSQEGPLGAFLKGIITTILATPCIAPFLGTAITWAVSQPPANTYAVFGFAGLGMASPYLAIGAFPGLIRLLPKPGEWMVTFKQVMGFVLLGTVIYLLTFIDYARILPAVLLLTGIAAACWWISRTPYTAELGEKVKAWLVAGTITAVVAYVSFAETVGTFPVVRTVPGLYGVMQYRLDKYVARHSGQQIEHQEGELPWQYFSPQKLAQLKQQGKTVLVDITADWCLTCKTLEQTVLNTDEVIELVDQNDVATLLADYTDYPPDIQQMLDKLQSNGIPVVAIFPAG